MYIYLILIKYVLHNLIFITHNKYQNILTNNLLYLYIIIYITYYVKNVVNKGDYYYLSILNIHIPYH